MKIPPNTPMFGVERLKRVTDPAILAQSKRWQEESRLDRLEEFFPTRIPDTHHTKRLVEVSVGGKAVATIYQSGGVSVDDQHSGIVLGLDLQYLSADQVAKKVAEALGGVLRPPSPWK